MKAESTEFRSLIGGFMYLPRNTRPDILYAANYLSRFQSDWGTRKQSRTMTLMAAAKYVALNDVTKTILFIRALNKEILSIEETAVIYEDNTSAVNIAKGTDSKENRFWLTKFFAIRQAVEANEIEIINIAGKFQVADILTKATDVTTFLRLRNFVVDVCSD